ncbi:MAG: hypothetical protein EBE86_011695 [Hormoscilla sp. GUM202]|nr:hypothetical protein [Hormoscilla sp. GM7CHS1pb]MBO1348014.1 hypothetical protein [Hormoscilla sp. GUM202]
MLIAQRGASHRTAKQNQKSFLMTIKGWKPPVPLRGIQNSFFKIQNSYGWRHAARLEQGFKPLSGWWIISAALH